MLAVDVGNTCTKFCMFTGDEAIWLEKTDTLGISVKAVTELFSEVELAGEDVFIASVVTPVNQLLEQAFTDLGVASVTLIRATDNILPHSLATIETTGVDRLLTAFSAKVLCPDEAVVAIQAGSAITVDFVSKDGVFAGGMIMPGPEMWLGSLTSAAMLPVIPVTELSWKKEGAGNSTRSAILNGASAGLVGAVKEAVRRLVMQSKDVPQIVITGGWSEPLAEFFPARCESDLVLTGIYLYAHTRENQEQAEGEN